MAELGSGGGSDYPTSLDTDTIKEVDNSTLVRADVPNDLAAAIVNIENELGTSPSGSKADVKTYLQTEHATDGTHGAVTATSLSTGDVALKVKTLEIGDWDMNADATHNVAHGLGASYKNIRAINAIIREDSDTTYYEFFGSSNSKEKAGGINSIDSTNIVLEAAQTGDWQNTNFDDVGGAQGNRGWVTVWYV